MIVAIHQPQYLPWVPYFDKAASCDVFVYLDNVQFQKNGLQNRNQIKSATGAAWLTVPVHASLTKTIAETPIADSHWQKKHIRSIEMNYARAPYLEWFYQHLKPLLESDWKTLAELNIAVTELLFTSMQINCKRVRASSLPVSGTADELVMNICEAVGAKVYVSGQGARAYHDEKKFLERGIELHYQEYRNQAYPQCHPKIGYVPDLSALDMVLNVGPSAGDVMRAGRQGCDLAVHHLG
jgi:WbqC-like protein family